MYATRVISLIPKYIFITNFSTYPIPIFKREINTNHVQRNIIYCYFVSVIIILTKFLYCRRGFTLNGQPIPSETTNGKQEKSQVKQAPSSNVILALLQ
jgi:hypothetical protein